MGANTLRTNQDARLLNYAVKLMNTIYITFPKKNSRCSG